MGTKDKEFSFLEDFKKDVEKMEEVSLDDEPPRYWYSIGNYVLNMIMSGKVSQGIPQGRITTLAGPAAAGKSFIAANLVRAAQEAGAFCLVIDSESALDPSFMTAIGVDINRNYMRIQVSTIPKVIKLVSTFLKRYKSTYGDGKEALPLFIVIDSLDMLVTETEHENFESGITKGDQGQRNRQLKAMLRNFVHAIKYINASMVVTAQVYQNQDILNGEGKWIVSDAIRYSASQIILVQKRKLKDESALAKAGDVAGVRMICEGYKTRFTKPFQRVEIEVPYSTGMDPCSGLVEVAEKLGVIVKRGNRYHIDGEDELWFKKNIDEHAPRIIDKIEQLQSVFLSVDGETESSKEPSARSRRQAAFESEQEENLE